MTDARTRREIEELHRFFVDWFTGRLELPAFERARAVMHPDFVLISPRGVRTECGPLLAELEQAMGVRLGTDFDIWIENHSERHLADGLWLVEYEEHQRIAGKLSARLSTALLLEAPDAPAGFRWLRVHETWLPGQAVV